MKIHRRFTKPGQDIFSTVEYEKRTSRISNPDGSVVFEMNDAEIPKSWSQLATDIMVSKYFRKAGVPQVDADGQPLRDAQGNAVTGPERSARQVIHRLAGCWRGWGERHGYFDTPEDAQAFYDELAHMMLHQMCAPNSPQWFNTGLNFAYGITGPAQGHAYCDPKTGEIQKSKNAYERPQVHACFIQSIKDDLVNPGGIMDLWTREARIFKYGSGTGSNFSKLRGENEPLSGGGKSSGLMSFLRIGDRAAGAIKSGGTTRRAAKMVCLDLDHPDIENFVNWKVREELKVAAMAEGIKHLAAEQQETAKRLKLKLDYDFNGEAYYTVSGQNSNNSVRIPNRFFESVQTDGEWRLHFRTNGKVAKSLRARELWDQIAFAAWRCADPGVQYDDTINQWHTCPKSGRINASNPCVTGDTRVLTPGGIWRRIDQMIHLPARIVTNRDAQEIHAVDGSFPTGTKDVYELRTAGGYSVKVTCDHKIFTRNRGWVEAQDLEQGDEVRLVGQPAAVKEIGEPTDARFFQLLGMFVSSANHDVDALHLDACLAPEAVDDYARYVHQHWGERAYADDYVNNVMIDLDEPESDSVPGASSSSGSTLTARCDNRRLLSRMRAYVKVENGSRRLTDEAFTAGLAAQKHLLRALFTADGAIDHGTLTLWSDSTPLLSDVQLLLLGFGVQSALITQHSSLITDSHDGGAVELGGLPTGRPTASPLQSQSQGGDDASAARGDGTTTPPRAIADPRRHGLRIDPGSLRSFGKHVGLLPGAKLALLADAIGNAISKPQFAPNHDRVASVTYLGRQQVFDLTEPVTHSFVANGITVHNCSEYMFLDDTACFAPETRISTPNGLRTVEELFVQQERGVAVHITTDLYSEHDHRRITAHRPAVVTKVGEREVFTLTLRDGRSIRATADHRFLTARGEWKRLDQLQVGVDRLEVRHSGTPVAFDSPQSDVERWQLLGWLSGDGVFSNDTAALVFGPQEAECARTMCQRFNRLITESASFARVGKPETCNLSTQANGVLQVSCRAQHLISFLQERFGLRQGTAIHKDVPAAVLHASTDLQVAYLQGLFSADGCIRKAATEHEVMLASSSPEMLRSVQLILSDLGITSRITWHHPAGRKNPQGQLHIYNQQARKFLTLVGFPCSQAKSALAAEILSKPFEAARKNPRPSAVTSIEPSGVTTVYDVTEPVTHSVIAEGIIAHNCNLASLNVLTFFDAEHRLFDIESFKHAVRVWTVVLEISVLMASFPSDEIARLSYMFRTLGLGYANLGAMLMQAGIPYDSDKGRAICAALTAILTGESYAASAEMARELGAFPGYESNRSDMLRVIRNHRRAAYDVSANAQAARSLGTYEGLDIRPVGIDSKQFGDDPLASKQLLSASQECWDRALFLGERHGYRNAQATVIAPTGTIGLLMDCDTTGVEPDFALVKFKKLAGGGYFKIANQSLRPALVNLGYTPEQIHDVMKYVMGTLSLHDAPHVNWQALKQMGFTVSELEKVEQSLPGTFELSFAFSPWSLGEAFFERMNIPTHEWQAPGFNLLRKLGFTRKQIDRANDHICGRGTVEGAPHLASEHYAVFDCANKCGKLGQRFIPVEGHIRMMAAAQPFISGAISKTINLPNEANVEDIKNSYELSWKLGLKANALYRDGSKLSQPLNVKSDEDLDASTDEEDQDAVEAAREEVARDVIEASSVLSKAHGPAVGLGSQSDESLRNVEPAPSHTHIIEKIVERIVERPLRRRLPDTRNAITHKFDIAGHEGYITAGLYEDGSPGEVFITMAKEGSTIGGLMDAVATLTSVALQYGVPVESLVRKFEHVRFEPAGMTRNADIPMAKSLVDYIFRWLAMEFVPGYRAANAPKRSKKSEVRDQRSAESATPSPRTRGEGGGEGSASDSIDEDAPAHHPSPITHDSPKPGNGHGRHIEPDAKPLDYDVEPTEGTASAITPSPAHPVTHSRLGLLADPLSQQGTNMQADAPACDVCGSITVRSGTCYKCLNCGNSMGCS